MILAQLAGPFFIQLLVSGLAFVEVISVSITPAGENTYGDVQAGDSYYRVGKDFYRRRLLKPSRSRGGSGNLRLGYGLWGGAGLFTLAITQAPGQ